MAQTEQIDLSTTMIQLRGIEMLSGTLNLPPDQEEPIAVFNFNVQIESKVDADQKLVFVIVAVDVKDNEDLAKLYGSLMASCIFHVQNFDAVITFNADGTSTIPRQLNSVLNALAISTMRGIMFSTFKGTYLHGAILPILDVQQFQAVEAK